MPRFRAARLSQKRSDLFFKLFRLHHADNFAAVIAHTQRAPPEVSKRRQRRDFTKLLLCEGGDGTEREEQASSRKMRFISLSEPISEAIRVRGASQKRYRTPIRILRLVRNTCAPVWRSKGNCTLPSTTNLGAAAYCSPGAR